MSDGTLTQEDFDLILNNFNATVERMNTLCEAVKTLPGRGQDGRSDTSDR